MSARHTLKLLKGRFRSDLIVPSKGVATLDIFLQNEGRLLERQFSGFDRFNTTPTHEGSLSCCLQIAHPGHGSKRGGQIALPIALNRHNRNRTHLPTFAPTHRKQVHRVVAGSYELEACAQQGHCQNISQIDKPRSLLCFCHMFLLLLWGKSWSC